MTDSTEAKTCSTVLYPSVLCFGWLDWSQTVFDCVRPKRAIIRTARIELVMFRPTGLKQDVFDHVRPKRKRAMFPSTRPELVIFCQTRLKLKFVWPCSTQAQACYICSESTWTGYVFARLDQKLKVFDRVRPNRAMFRLTRLKPNCVWLRSTQARYNSNGSNQTGYVSTYRTEARCVWPCSTQAQACYVSSFSIWTGYALPNSTESKTCLTVFDPSASVLYLQRIDLNWLWFCQTRPKVKSVWPCSTQPCVLCIDQIVWNNIVLTVFERNVLFFNRLRSNWLHLNWLD